MYARSGSGQGRPRRGTEPTCEAETIETGVWGGIRDWKVANHLKLGIGALYAFDVVPSLVPSYGSDPHGAMVFVRAVAD